MHSNRENGQGFVEYAIRLVVIAVAVIVVINIITPQVKSFNSIPKDVVESIVLQQIEGAISTKVITIVGGKPTMATVEVVTEQNRYYVTAECNSNYMIGINKDNTVCKIFNPNTNLK